jgi:tetratricopeptide (TPR) repeat protein
MLERYQSLQTILIWVGSIGAIVTFLSPFLYQHLQEKVNSIKNEEKSLIDEDRHEEVIQNMIRGNESIINQLQINRSYLKSIEYTELKQNVEDLQILLSKATDLTERLDYDYRLQIAKEKLKRFEEEVVQLAELLTKIDISSERLISASKLVDVGKYEDANTILDSISMSTDLESLIRHEEEFRVKSESKARELKRIRTNLANEFLLKAKLVELRTSDDQRLNNAYSLYRKSIEIERGESNLVQFSRFLDRNNFTEATKAYEEALGYSKESKNEELSVLIKHALALNYSARLNYVKAENLLIEALAEIESNNLIAVNIRIDLASTQFVLGEYEKAKNNYDILIKTLRSSDLSNQDIKHSLATCLSNSGVSGVYDLRTSMAMLDESIQHFRSLRGLNVENEAQLAKALTNYGVLVKRGGDNNKAKALYSEALSIREKLFNNNPSIYGEDFAFTLNNLGNVLHEIEYLDRALQIRRTLAIRNPDKFSYQVAQTLFNISLSHARVGKKKEAIESVDEAILLLRPLKEKTPEFNRYFSEAIQLRKKYQKL